MEEADIEPSETHAEFVALRIVIPESAPRELKRLLLLHELVEAYTGSHLVALFYEFAASPLLSVKWRLREGDLEWLFWPLVIVTGLVAGVYGSLNSSLLIMIAGLLELSLALVLASWLPAYRWALRKIREVEEVRKRGEVVA